MRISELLKSGPTLSVELWPARTVEAAQRLTETLERLAGLDISFASITYGAGGSTRDSTHELVSTIQSDGAITPMAHLVTAAHRRDELVEILTGYRDAGVRNILALRGDPPLSQSGPLEPGELAHAIELVELARSVGDFCVAVAAQPEGHPDSPDFKSDRRYLAEKLEVADFAITQFFFRIEDYLTLVEDLDRLGIDKPVLPGIMPIINVRSVTRMAELSGCVLPSEITDRIEAAKDDPAAVREIGIEVATELCEELVQAGAPGLHFFTLNQLTATLEVCSNLGLLQKP